MSRIGRGRLGWRPGWLAFPLGRGLGAGVGSKTVPPAGCVRICGATESMGLAVGGLLSGAQAHQVGGTAFQVGSKAPRGRLQQAKAVLVPLVPQQDEMTRGQPVCRRTQVPAHVSGIIPELISS